MTIWPMSRVVCDNGTVVMWEHPLRVFGRVEDPVSDIYSQIVLRPWVQSLVLPEKEKATVENPDQKYMNISATSLNFSTDFF